VPKLRDLRGQRFGGWRVLTRVLRADRKIHWRCRCDCGQERDVNTENLTSGRSKSCGCVGRAARTGQGNHNYKHGRTDTPEYNVWYGMRQRCNYPKHSSYHLYGGRGIRVCRRWQRSFEAFFADMGPRPSSEHSIDRIENDGNYEPGNCRWALGEEQQSHTRTSRFLTVNGVRKTMAQWSRTTKIDTRIIHSRLQDGWSEERAVMTPVRVRHQSSVARNTLSM